MLRVKKVAEYNKENILRHLKADVIKHVFALYDVQHEPEHTTTYAAYRKNSIEGYILIYTKTDVPSVVLESKEDAAATLILHAPKDHFIMHTSPELATTVAKRFPHARTYIENWMLVKRNEANCFNSMCVRRLCRDDASSLARLVLSRKDRPKRNLRRYVEWINNMPLYGLFKDGELVSYAGSFIQLPQVWMIGGVYTHANHRNKGYALLATSAITREALMNAEAAALFVRSDNYPAIRIYEKIGYKKIGEKLWVDVGTGMKP